MKDNKGSQFFEPRTIIAFVLTISVFVLWQNHMNKKYPHIYNSKAKQVKDIEPDTKSEPHNSDLFSQAEDQKKLEDMSKPFVESLTKVETENWLAEISNSGLTFKTTQLNEYKERDLSYVAFYNLFRTSFYGISEPIPFEVTQTGHTVVGVYKTEKGEIKKTLVFNSNNYSVDVSYDIKGDFPGISVSIEMPVNESVKSSLLFPTFEKQEFVVINSEGEDRDLITATDFATRSFKQVKLISLGTQFFSNAIVDRSSLKPNVLVYTEPSSKKVYARLDYEFSKDLKSFLISQTYFAGPKDDVILKSVDKDMIALINFGMFKVICEPILMVLKFFYGQFSNYGIAIILLTLLMRLLVFPIAYRGYKSMDKMQKIQPMLKQIREKYKDDSQKANLETMALMKEHKVNPVGGCLPMLLQLPIFFAFYRVLSESIVMYQAPFALWITDLSLKDPFYILPILMGLTMFIQQKLTPTALEPMQQRVMLFMPLIFSVFMISLPSALTLYIFVSTLFGVLQQYLFTKSK